jgi:hypothetical protein
VVVVREAQTPNNFGDKGFLGFERVTMVSSFSRSLGTVMTWTWGRCPLGATLSTCHSFPPTSACGWMRITRRYGRRCRLCSKAMRGPERGCVANAPRCNSVLRLGILVHVCHVMILSCDRISYTCENPTNEILLRRSLSVCLHYLSAL